MLFKTIIQGKIEFGTQKAYDMAVKMYTTRAEKYFKNDIMFTIEEIFFPDTLNMYIPRLVKQVFDKCLKNTSALLEYIVQFGISGELYIWQLNEGKILHYKHLEPSSDKVAVQQFIKGKNLINEKGKEEEAISALNKAIEKYSRHAQAYERRATVNFILKKNHDALRDYKKSIGLDPDNPSPYYGSALVHISNKEIEEAIENLGMAIKKSVALQSIHWKCRRLKGNLHLQLKEYEKAEFELKLFTKRKFDEENPNFKWKREGHYNYGLVLTALEKHNEAVESFDLSLSLEKGSDKISKKEKLRSRGIAKQKAGLNGYISDIKEAADLGDNKAKKLLEEIS